MPSKPSMPTPVNEEKIVSYEMIAKDIQEAFKPVTRCQRERVRRNVSP